MQSWLQDIRFGMRMLRRSPLFAAVAVVILGVGIGANTTIFSVVNALVFRPLPYREPGRLVFLTEGSDRLKTWGGLSHPDYADYKEQNRAMEDMAAMQPDAVDFSGAEEPERLRGLRASAQLMPLLGLPLKTGRSFLAEDCVPGKSNLVILSHALWQRRFGSRTDILGQTIRIDGTSHSVVGVLSPQAKMGFLLGFEPELWLPLVPPNPPQRGFRNLAVIGRLKPGVSVSQSQGEMEVIARRLDRQYPDSNAGWRVLVAEVRAKVDTIAYVLLALLVCSVLGIACMNVANLVLARTSARAKELALRQALGASRRRVVRQLFTESFLLAFWGCCLGILTAFAACRLIRAYSAGSNMEILDIRMDGTVLAATLLLLLFAATVVGLIPALRLSGGTLCQSLKEGGAGSSGGSPNRAGNILAALEIALSLVLLVGGGLATKSWFRLWQVDPGFRPENVLTLSLSVEEGKHAGKDRQTEFFQSLLERLKGRSDLRGAGIASALPATAPQFSFIIQGRSRPEAGEEPQARCTSSSPGYFETMGIALKAGKLFSESDTSSAPPVVVVNETLARKYWPDGSPVGGQVEVWGRLRTIIGVIGDQRSVPLAMRPKPEIYLPYLQNAGSHMMLAVRTTGDPLVLAAALKQEIRALDPDQPVQRPETMEKVRAHDMGVITTGSRLLAILGVGALMLAAAGLYGVLSYSVARRVREFGIRMALGAGPGNVLSLVLAQSVRLSLWGIGPGLVAALLLTRVLSRVMYGVTALEPLIICAIALMLCAISLLAGYVPARRATRVDPMMALRSE